MQAMETLKIRVERLGQAMKDYADELRLAQRYMASDPASSVTKSRVILESLLLQVYSVEMGREPKKPLVGDILTDNQFTRRLEERIVSRMNAIRDLANFGPHAKGKALLPEDAARVLDDLCVVLDWYLGASGPAGGLGGARHGQAVPGAVPAVPCPYRGLSAFREEDAPCFFGRDRFTREVVKAVPRRAFLAVIGPSGSGKSSLIFGGVLPLLRGDPAWLIASLRPGDRPCYNLAAALLPLLEPGMKEADRLGETRKIVQGLERGDYTLEDVLRRALDKHPPASRLLLVVDQAEELYALCREPGERERFLDQVLSLTRGRRPGAPSFTVLLTLRADFLGHALLHRPLADALQHADLKLGPMSRNELQEAVEGPAKRAGVQTEEGLTERILSAVREGPGHLPLLQFALTLLWARQQDGQMTHAAYEAIGGVERALADYASEVYEQLEPEEQERARHVFLQLIRPGQGTEDTRRLAGRAEVGDANWELVTRLATGRLVVTGRDPSTGEETVEVVHEALIREWGQLRAWLEEAREFRIWQERLRGAMRQWEASGQDDGALLRGAPLAEAEAWLVWRPAEISAREAGFIRASSERQAQEQQRWKDLYEKARRAEERLDAANRGLEERVRQRTEELTRTVADLERAGEALRASEGRFRGTFENVAVGIAHADLDGRWLRVNEKLCAILGYPREELLQKTFRDVTHPDNLARSIELFTALMVGELPGYVLETRYLRKDGTVVWVELVASLQRDSAGEPAYAIVVLQEISERKRLEGELRQAKEVAELANRAKAEFLANMSHEIRTPMNGIIGMTDLALATDLTREQREYLTLVKTSADALLDIIDDILDFSKIEAGKLRLNPVPFRLRDSLADTVRTLALKAQEKKLELACHIAPDVPDGLVGDLGRLRQVLVNLIGNAVKFTERGGVTVRAEVIAGAENTAEVHFTVQDTGVGIPSDQQVLIFTRFYQGDTSVTRRYGGTGLGLAIASKLVALMGGRIWVESAVGRGSTFHFTARFGVTPSPASLLQTAAADPERGRQPQLPPLHILLAEDNEVNQRLVVSLLEKHGHRVTVATNGRDTIAAWEKGQFDLILMDVQMPELDGLAAATAIRQREQSMGRRLPILALTAHALKGQREICLAAGMDGYITKPIRSGELFAAMAEVLTWGQATSCGNHKGTS